MNSLAQIVAGDAADIPIQAWLFGGAQPAAYGAGDTLVGYVYQNPRSPTPLFTAAVTWYTAPSRPDRRRRPVMTRARSCS